MTASVSASKNTQTLDVRRALMEKLGVNDQVAVDEAVPEGIPEPIPVDACYLGWQESLVLLAQLVEAEIPD